MGALESRAAATNPTHISVLFSPFVSSEENTVHRETTHDLEVTTHD